MADRNYSVFIPPGVIEFARTVYSADYEQVPTAQSAVDEFMKTISEASNNDRVYLLEYLSTACDVALGLSDTRKYKKGMYENLNFDRKDAIRIAVENYNSEMKAVDENKNLELKSINEKEKSLLKRFIPAGTFYVSAKSVVLSLGSILPDYLYWAPEVVSSILLVGADLSARYDARKDRRAVILASRKEKKDITRKYNRQLKEIGQNYTTATSELEKLTDEKNRERFVRAEKKLTNCYESCYGIDLEGVWDMMEAWKQGTSAEELKSNDGEITKRHLKRVDPIV